MYYLPKVLRKHVASINACMYMHVDVDTFNCFFKIVINAKISKGKVAHNAL